MSKSPLLEQTLNDEQQSSRMKTYLNELKQNSLDRMRPLDPHAFCKDIQQYFDDVSYRIDLQKLYNPISTCYYSTQMRYLPALFHVSKGKDRNQTEQYTYQLQFWDTQTYEMIFVKEIDFMPTKCAISFNYFFYVIDQEEDNSINLIYITDNVEIKELKIISNILNFKTKSLRYIELKDDNTYKHDQKIDIQSIITITKKESLYNQQTKNKTLIDFIIVIRQSNNSLDFNSLKLNQNPIEMKGVIENFLQLSDHSPELEQSCLYRSKSYNLKVTVVNDIVYAIALSEYSLDLYSDMVLRERMDAKDKNFKEIGMSLKAFYIRCQTKEGENSYYELKHQAQVNISFLSQKLIDDRSFRMSNIYGKILHDYVSIYKGFYLVDYDENPLCLVAHFDTISAFDIMRGEFTQRIKFEDEILAIFEQEYSNNQKQNQSKMICLILKNLDVHIDIMSYIGSQRDNIIQEKPSFSLSQHFGIDSQKFEFLDIGSEKGQGTYFFIYSSNKIVCINEGLLFDDIDTGEKCILKMNYINQLVDQSDKIKLLITNEQKIVLYEIKELAPSFGYQNDQEKVRRKIKLEKQKDLYDTLEGQLLFHSALTLDLNHHIILVSKQFVVLLDNQGNILKATSRQIVNGDFIGKDFSYLLRQESQDSTEHGLFMFNVPFIVDRRDVQFLLLKQIDVGHNPHLKLFKNVERIGFMQSISCYVVHPYLHLNNIKLMGVESYGKSLLSKQIGQLYMRLTERNLLIVWNVMTGKIVDKIIVEKDVFNRNEELVFEKNHSEFLLLVSRNQTITSEKSYDANYVPKQKTWLKDQITISKQLQPQKRKWKIVEVKKVEDSIDISTKQFDFPYSENQVMLINSDITLMIVITDWIRVSLYAKVQEQNGFIKWQHKFNVSDFPFYFEKQAAQLVSEQPHFNYLSPDFKYYLIYNTSGLYQIKTMVSQELVGSLGKGAVSMRPKQTLRQAVNRFHWIDSTRFLVVSDDGIQKTYKLGENNQILEEGYNVIPIKEVTQMSKYLIDAEIPFKSLKYGVDGDILTKLRECYQLYKQNYYLNAFPEKKDKFNLLFRIHSTEFSAQTIQSFSFLHWTLTDRLVKGIYPVKNIPILVFEIVLFSMLPEGNILHALKNQTEKLLDAFDRCHNDNGILYHVPFLPNIDGEDPFTRVLQNNLPKDVDQKQLFSVLKYLKFYEIDHHSRCIKHLYPKIISTGTQIALDYFESRFKSTLQLEAIKTGVMNSDNIVSSPQLNNQVIEEIQGTNNEDEKKVSIKLELLDMPGIYHFRDKHFSEFFRSLQDVEGYGFFTNRAIMQIVDFNFPYVKHALMTHSVIPFAVYHLLSVIYMNAIYETRNESEGYQIANITFGIILIGFSFYFLCSEIRQCINIGMVRYFDTFWNYVDILAPISVLIVQGFSIVDKEDMHISNAANRYLLAISTLLMWIKFISNLRIFEKTNYLIRMVYEVITDMGIFLFVYAVTVAAFGDAFLRISSGNEKDDQFISSFAHAFLYAYSMTLGGFETDKFGTIAVELVWLLWVMCTIIGMIVMLNLLIAIISGSHEKVIQNQLGAQYKEMAELILENSYLVPMELRESYVDMNKLMIKVTLNENHDEAINTIEQQLDSMKNQLVTTKDIMEKNISGAVSELQARQKVQDTTLNNILKNVGELRYQFIKTQYKEQTIQVKIYPQPLTLVMLREVQEWNQFQMYESWFCRAKKFTGCKSGQTRAAKLRIEMDENLYHCNICNFDFCEKCFSFYKNSHKHEMVKTSYGDIHEKYQGGWECKARYFRSCQTDSTLDLKDPYMTFYHRKSLSRFDEQFDLCVDCAQYYADQTN
ncbi:UNKNOWN [Stylonychia lemnae]|uniref:Ion transport domain-containing protein n=1 Tax=Stylonychia lemnae TaxID=5949 RepID=A0A077ZQB0_STYLE|nr:UNKNOWN [Stylonychia lemnae]|eukprot:CDW71585.1 UNKNOWN [Stylonychia lemnae]